jgi:hypothetical protein
MNTPDNWNWMQWLSHYLTGYPKLPTPPVSEPDGEWKVIATPRYNDGTVDEIVMQDKMSREAADTLCDHYNQVKRPHASMSGFNYIVRHTSSTVRLAKY